MKKLLLYIVLFFCMTQQLYPQEGGVVAFNIPVRNSLKFNRQIINPTFSFVREQNRYISFSNKREWVQFDDAPETYLFGYSGRFQENIGAGVTLFQQNYGVLTTFGGVVNFAYNAVLDRDSNLTFGMNLGFYKNSLGSVIVYSQDSSLDNFPSNSVITINPGINYGTEFLDFGISVKNLVSYNLTTSKMIEENPEQSIQGHIMYTGYLNSRGFFDESRFSGLISTDLKKDQTVVSAMAMLMVPKGIWVQAGYNSLYALSAGIGVNISPQIAFEYNYEKGVGGFSTFGNSHDITLAYKFKNNNRYDYSGDDDEEALLFVSDKKRRKVVKRKTSSPSKTRKKDAPVLTDNKEAKVEGLAKAKAIEEAKVKAAQEEQTRIAEAARVQAEEVAKAKALKEAKVKVAQEEARIAEAARVEVEEAAKAKSIEEAKVKAAQEEEARLAEAARVEAEEAAKAKAIEEAKVKAAQEEQERLAEVARVQAEEAVKAKALEEARLKAEAEETAKVKAAELEAEKAKAIEAARVKAEEVAKTKALEEAKVKAAQEEQERLAELARVEAEEAVKAKALEEARLKAEAEETAKVKAAELEAEKAKAIEAARVKAEQEQEAKIKAINLDEVLIKFNKSTEASKNAQQELLDKLNEKVSSKQQDLNDLKEENDLSEKGIVSAPKAFKSVSAENAEIESLKLKIDNSIEFRNAKITEIETLYKERLRKFKSKDNSVNKEYLKTIEALKTEQQEAIDVKQNLVSTLDIIKKATDFERSRRIKRAAYDNDNDRYLKDRAALERIKKFTPLSSESLTKEDFDNGETLSNIQIVKDVNNVEEGYYLVIAVHNTVVKRDEFLAKAVAAGEKNINFFFDVNTSKYYIYYEDFNNLNEAKTTLDSNKGSKPYNSKMSIVKIEN